MQTQLLALYDCVSAAACRIISASREVICCRRSCLPQGPAAAGCAMECDRGVGGVRHPSELRSPRSAINHPSIFMNPYRPETRYRYYTPKRDAVRPRSPCGIGLARAAIHPFHRVCAPAHIFARKYEKLMNLISSRLIRLNAIRSDSRRSELDYIR